MLKFTSSGDLARLPKTDPAHPVISLMIENLFTDSPETEDIIALMEPDDINHPLTQLWNCCDPNSISLERILQQQGMFLIVLQTREQIEFGIVLVIPDAEWVTGELRRCIEQNLYN